ncbi:MerR family transcriptional regulator [Ureibacillus aquaedulcis]|uniref:MerR family transcriptional regulator n=1 Tax=Ureibacillus aquaedulcis TaxID=3058421 RepID=A0ABT8GV22_9BACL|nr:MerR family transcriptional regulator [Ureibacillus sp. BA0131]MDN4495263.1 MerR family transcriptional regulator [Ureibacillus sp. BA0131]
MSDLTVVPDTSTVENVIYTTQMVSKIVGVPERTLRNYCSFMQDHHYDFQKNKNGHRIYYKKDVEIIKKIIDLKTSNSLTMQQAVSEILGTTVEELKESPPKKSKEKMDIHHLLEEFSTFKNEQMEFNKKLLEQLIKQEHYIKNSIEERDKKLMYAMKESMETRRQLAAAAETERERETKKKVWWQFWK